MIFGFCAIRLATLRCINPLEPNLMLNIAFAENNDGVAVGDADRPVVVHERIGMQVLEERRIHHLQQVDQPQQ